MYAGGWLVNLTGHLIQQFYNFSSDIVLVALQFQVFGKSVYNGLSQDGRPFLLEKGVTRPGGVLCFGGQLRRPRRHKHL